MNYHTSNYVGTNSSRSEECGGTYGTIRGPMEPEDTRGAHNGGYTPHLHIQHECRRVEAQTWNGTTVSARVVPDDTMYSASQETQSIKIRRQNPTAKLRSLCEVATFVSGGGTRTSERVQWSENGVRCEVPSV